MRGGFWRVTEGPAHLCEALSIEPALADALFDGPAVGARFATADVMMAALVMEHEKADGIAVPGEQAGIQNNDAACRSLYDSGRAPGAGDARILTINPDRTEA